MYQLHTVDVLYPDGAGRGGAICAEGPPFRSNQGSFGSPFSTADGATVRCARVCLLATLTTLLSTGAIQHRRRSFDTASRWPLSQLALDERLHPRCQDFTVNFGAPGSVGRDSSTGNLCFESASVALRPRICWVALRTAGSSCPSVAPNPVTRRLA
jgi:hypothetical protein